MYQAKNNGKACHVIFDERMHSEAIERLNQDRLTSNQLGHQTLGAFLDPFHAVISIANLGEVLGFRLLLPQCGLCRICCGV